MSKYPIKTLYTKISDGVILKNWHSIIQYRQLFPQWDNGPTFGDGGFSSIDSASESLVLPCSKSPDNT